MRMPVAGFDNALIEIDFSRGHLASQRPRAGQLGQRLDLDAERDTYSPASLVAQGERHGMRADRQDPMRHETKEAARERILAVRERGLDIEAPQSIVGKSDR